MKERAAGAGRMGNGRRRSRMGSSRSRPGSLSVKISVFASRIGLFALLMLPSLAEAAETAETSCTLCHSDAEFFEGADLEIAASFAHDVHAEIGLSCHDCHGGNPDPGLADDLEAAMDEDYAENPYRGAPDRAQVPAFCGRCHSDPAYMKRFKPDPRIDQEREYYTSQHGQMLAAGDENVAVCIDCHGVHGILRAGNPESSVYPTRVAETCGGCHADPGHMAGYKLPDGRPLPVDQYSRWQRSVHAQALLVKEDLSAPTCNDCHGNHGAVPPGLESITLVCGQCHGREARLFETSEKISLLEAHNENLADAGGGGCKECHDPPDPAGRLETVHAFTQCSICHQNHAVIRPTVAILGQLPSTPCVFCHEPEGPLAEELTEPESIREHYERVRDQLLAEADGMGLEGHQLFDWLVDRALTLPVHSLNLADDNGDGARLRPEFEELFLKFRIGKTRFTYFDPLENREVEAKVRQCSDCHSPDPELADEAVGYTTAGRFLAGMKELTGLTARAERLLVNAQRRGVEVRKARENLERAVDSQIELEVLVHTFSADDSSLFAMKQAEGIEFARASLEAGRDAMGELAKRRNGLKVSLVFIGLTLIGLALLIRRLSLESSG